MGRAPGFWNGLYWIIPGQTILLAMIFLYQLQRSIGLERHGGRDE